MLNKESLESKVIIKKAWSANMHDWYNNVLTLYNLQTFRAEQ